MPKHFLRLHHPGRRSSTGDPLERRVQVEEKRALEADATAEDKERVFTLTAAPALTPRLASSTGEVLARPRELRQRADPLFLVDVLPPAARRSEHPVSSKNILMDVSPSPKPLPKRKVTSKKLKPRTSFSPCFWLKLRLRIELLLHKAVTWDKAAAFPRALHLRQAGRAGSADLSPIRAGSLVSLETDGSL